MNRRTFLAAAAGGAAVAAGGGGYGLFRLLHEEPKPRPRSFRSRPDLRPPAVEIDRADGDTPAGYVFLGVMGGPGQRGLLIVDDAGEPVWFRPTPGPALMNLRVQHYRGEPVLTYWEGRVAKGYGEGDGVLLDRSYREIGRVRGANGLRPDLHDLLLTPEGTALYPVYHPVRRAARTVVENVVQEVDVATGALRFEWRSLEHVPTRESQRTPPKTGAWDYLHANSVDVDRDGNLLVSARHSSTVYKVDRRSGDVLWRLGGKRGDFRLGPGARFAFQHDARRLPDGTISIFDNGAPPRVEPQSRAIVLALDEDAMTAELVRAYTDGRRAKAMGSMQLLPDGSVFVGWGTEPVSTQFAPDGAVRFRLRLPKGGISYRAFRFPWRGDGPGRPAVSVHGRELAVSWNGATEVALWRLEAGPSERRLATVRETPRTGFETLLAVDGGHAYAAVAALDRDGTVLGRSRTVALDGV